MKHHKRKVEAPHPIATPLFAAVVQPKFKWVEFETDGQGLTKIPGRKNSTAEIFAPSAKTPVSFYTRHHELLHARFTPALGALSAKILKGTKKPGASRDARAAATAIQVAEDVRLSFIDEVCRLSPPTAYLDRDFAYKLAEQQFNRQQRLASVLVQGGAIVRSIAFEEITLLLAAYNQKFAGPDGKIVRLRHIAQFEVLGQDGPPMPLAFSPLACKVFAALQPALAACEAAIFTATSLRSIDKGAVKQQFLPLYTAIVTQLQDLLRLEDTAPPPEGPGSEDEDEDEDEDEEAKGKAKLYRDSSYENLGCPDEETPPPAPPAWNKQQEERVLDLLLDRISFDPITQQAATRAREDAVKAEVEELHKALTTQPPTGGDAPPPVVYTGSESLLSIDPLDHIPWAPMRIAYPPTVRDVRQKVLRQGRAGPDGTLPKHVTRWFADRAIMDTRGRLPGGTLLIDVSGSMSWSQSLTLELIQRAPLATIAVYSGWYARDADPTGTWDTTKGERGTLTLLARNGRAVAHDYDWQRGHGQGNLCDGPALSWLIRQPGPRIWFCDGATTVRDTQGIRVEMQTDSSRREAERLLRLGNIWRTTSIKDVTNILARRPHGAVRDSTTPLPKDTHLASGL